MYQKIILKNGARLILVPRLDSPTASILVMAGVGSRYESDEVAGVSHFIEHMMFKGTKKRPNTLAISKELDGVGAEFNAFTGKDGTGYYVKAAAQHLPMALEVLSDMLINSKFDAKEINREKGVIVEEINMYEDNPLMYVDDLLEQIMFPSPLGRSIAGRRETVKGMTREKMIAYKNKFYRAKNIVIALTGKFQAGDVKAVKEKFAFSGSGERSGFKPVAVKQNKPRVKVQFKETEQTQIAIGLPGYAYNNPKLYPLYLLAIILGGNMSSRLFLRVRERNGLAYFIRSSLSIYQDTGALVIQAGLDKNRIDQALKLIYAELRKIGEVTPAELKRAKEYLAGKLVLDLEDTAQLGQWFAQQELLTGGILTPEEKIAKIMAVDRLAIKKVAREIIDFKKINLAVIGPFKDESRFAKNI